MLRRLTNFAPFVAWALYSSPTHCVAQDDRVLI
jgi:hypothetical protein